MDQVVGNKHYSPASHSYMTEKTYIYRCDKCDAWFEAGAIEMDVINRSKSVD